MNYGLVSIIMPSYNAASTIGCSIESVVAQTYKNWELIIVDDCSTDNTVEIVKSFIFCDSRIRLLSTPSPSGSPTQPRNLAIDNANGRFIAFLDSDDLWLPNKLEEQLPLFENSDVSVVFSYYQKMQADGTLFGSIITSPSRVKYNQLLRGNVIGNLTGIYDTFKVGKHYFLHIGHEDYAHWLDILRQGGYAMNTCKLHGFYRISANSISRNKYMAMLWTWNIYRNIEHLGIIKSVYCFLCYAPKGFLKVIS